MNSIEIGRLSFSAFGELKLRALCDAIGFADGYSYSRNVFRTLIEPWGDRPIGIEPSWMSDISDDHTPFEFSLAMTDKGHELRMLVEAQGESPTLESSWEAGLRLNSALRMQYGACTERFARIQELFSPSMASARFALWHAACIRRAEPPDFKVYLNPQCRGAADAPWIVAEALKRLGFERAWSLLEQRVMRRGAEDQVVYFSLDLSSGPPARIKVYVAHPAAGAEDMEAVMHAAGDHRYEPGMATAFCRALIARDGPYCRRPLVTCHSYTSDDDSSPTSITLHIPIRSYQPSDAEALQTILETLPSQYRETYRRAVTAMAHRDLNNGVGMQAWASTRMERGHRRMTIYLATEAYAVAPAHQPSRLPETPRSAAQMQAVE